MKLRLSLWTKVLLLAALNAALVVAVLGIFAEGQLKQDIDGLLLGEARERITSVALDLGAELPRTALKDRDAMLARYSKDHGVTFRLFHSNSVQVAGPPITLPARVDTHFKEQRARTPLLERPEIIVRLMQQNREIPREDSFALGRPQLDRLLAVITERPFVTRANDLYWVVFRMPLRSADESDLFQPGQLVLTTPSFFATPFFFNAWPWLGLAALLLLIGVLCWLPAARGATRSIAKLAEATNKVAAGSFDTRAEVRRGDELGQLGNSFNRMAAQLDNYVNDQKRFLRDAAHELRSPLARMQAALGNLFESPVGKDAAPYLEDLQEEIDLMSQLSGELLTYAREDEAQRKLGLVPVDLREMAARVVDTENPAMKADVRVHVEPTTRVRAHPDSLFRGLANVVRNAIDYAGADGPITVAAERRDGATIVTVRDRGPGIPEEALEMVFTPFFRLDHSRDRKTGGNGLGMAIARSCFQACQGAIHCRNVNPGLEVVITLQDA